MSVLNGECESIDDVEYRVQQLEDGITQKDQEITELLQEMAVLVAEDTTLTDITNVWSNSGKTIEEVSPRQARRKIREVTTFSKQALWFAESFGLIPDYVQMHKAQSGSPIKITIHDESPSPPSYSMPSESVYAKIRQVLYVLDRFAVSDEAYHELSVTSSLPPLHHLKEARSDLNASLDLKRLEGDNPGAYRPLVDALKQEISRIVHTVSVFIYMYIIYTLNITDDKGSICHQKG